MPPSFLLCPYFASLHQSCANFLLSFSSVFGIHLLCNIRLAISGDTLNLFSNLMRCKKPWRLSSNCVNQGNCARRDALRDIPNLVR
ncbi:hypothetical protein BDZ91DRAFT_716940 [Kalaharituber pfeilii]|nr:hypothetical protein BDZ91DRAFT_716940 [Kalaharituber pfeilii]